ncbi:hypothetical protein O0L34_g7417 [Tuta absoluta]|nr:hypothetical protein O0L34_g7417 [Tuta absoluta]
MNVILVLGVIFLAIYSCVSWLLPNVLAWLFMRKYHIKLKIGRIAVPKLILKDVSLSKDGYFIHINEISFRSSFFNSEINKLVSVVVQGLEITNNAEEKRSVVVETILKPLLSKQNSASSKEDEGTSFDLRADLSKASQKKLLDFRDKKLPHSLIMFAQFMGVHIFNVSVTIHCGSVDNTFTVQAHAGEVHADGAAGGPARALVFSANVVGGRVRAVRGAGSWGEAACGLLIEGTVKAQGPLNVEKIHAVVSNLTISFQDELYHLIQKSRTYKKPRPVRTDSEDHLDTLMTRLSPVIPKMFSLRIDATSIKCTDSIKTNCVMSLQSLQINSRFSAAPVLTDARGAHAVGLPQVYVAFQVDQYQLATAEDKLLFVNKLKLDAKLEKGVLNLYLIISTLSIIYHHNEVFKWYSSMMNKFKKSKAMQVQQEVKPTTTPPWIARVFSACVVQGCAELRTVTVHAHLGGGHAMAAGCGGVKVKLDQLLDTREEAYKSAVARLVVGSRHWSTELLVDGGWAAFGPRALTLREAPPRKQHAWGTALLAVALVKWGSQGPRDSKVEAMMDCLRLEWSPTVSSTVIALIDCLTAYRQPSAAPPARPLPEPDIEARDTLESPCNIAVNVALSHMNLFLIVSEAMCLMTRVDAVTLERSSVKAAALVSGVKLVDTVPYKMDAVTLERSSVKAAALVSGVKLVDTVPYKSEWM